MRRVPDMEFSVDDMRRMAEAVAARSIEHIASLKAQPVLGDVNARAFCRALREPAPETGRALEPLLDQLFDDYIPRSFNTPAPGYLAFIPGGGVFPAALADFITNAANRYTGLWRTAPALVQLEANALDWLRDWMGFPETTRGLFTTGGSMATFDALPGPVTRMSRAPRVAGREAVRRGEPSRGNRGEAHSRTRGASPVGRPPRSGE